MSLAEGIRAVVRQPGAIELEAFDVPTPKPDEVLLRTRTTLISPGTERAFFLAMSNTSASYPLYPGYSQIGDIIAVGEAVDDWRVGDRVASIGNHASHVVISAKLCHRVPDVLTDEQAVFFNLIAIAMQAIHKARIELGESVIVLGAGLIGLFAMQLAKLSGGLPVIAVDQHARRLDIATQLGADGAFVEDDRVLSLIRAYTGREGAAVVIEATGVPDVVNRALHLVGRRGRVLLLGSTRGLTESVNFYRDVHRKGISIIGAHETTRPTHDTAPGWWTQYDEHRVALNLLAANRLYVDSLVTHRFHHAVFLDAYELLRNWDGNALGMVIDWGRMGDDER
ncbi:MAG: alcohol dehydrogenase [Phototrophicales bacterium]|nr:MAG: alcohol dehydrogenase [Phototrophicales bacterium]